ncbi:RNA polymerase sigma-70 factor [Mucilaginibacter sp. HC2]|uniref:RNA polymerase sigma-70 factor n=1 Tax=Mucilaginibacter inviolabilis TaxID=2714892 RepID=UPI0014094428|nr:RNA polymerase sigma-70 factor [Mucilaginibacter inviolabilis]NHA02799.1 RNA polymerase sigma-70 factor [Mucilaginibacter inviolabilis]
MIVENKDDNTSTKYDGIYKEDISSFEHFYKVNYKKLHLVSFRYTNDHEQSEEIVHDIFLKIWDNLELLSSIKNIEAYLFRSVVNASLDFIKKSKRTVSLQKTFLENSETIEWEENNFDELENRLKLVEKAVEQLPPICKKVLLMSKYDKLKQQEIADTLNISIKTVKNHLTYGYKKIKEFINSSKTWILIFIIVLFG